MNTSVATPIPVIVLTGFLGAGKTTLLDNILNDETHRQRLGIDGVCFFFLFLIFFAVVVVIAVIQNEYAVGLGAETELTGSKRAACTAEIYETASGCLCCGGRGDFVNVLHQLAAHRSRFDQVVVETTGLADPSFMQAFFAEPTLAAAYRLASVVCVVDAQDIEARLDAQPVRLFF
jgi:G3E family GTPase